MNKGKLMKHYEEYLKEKNITRKESNTKCKKDENKRKWSIDLDSGRAVKRLAVI